MRRIRASWLILIAVIISVAAVPVLREQARLQVGPHSRPGLPLYSALFQLCCPPRPRAMYPLESDAAPPRYSIQAWVEPYRQRCIPFVQQHYPEDPEMLMAAGILAPEKSAEARLGLLARAADLGGGPVAWSACASALVNSYCTYMRLGTGGNDPGDSRDMAHQRYAMEQSGAPTKLSEEDAAPVLDALRRWQAEDPQNALPLAFEMHVLYGLHRDREAMGRWVQAGRLPVVEDYSEQQARSVAILLTRLGVPGPEAIAACWNFPGLSLAHLRTCARIAFYEGRLAQLRGHPDDAIAWWNATIDVGRHLQESTSTEVGFLVGVGIHGIGASPAWKWCHDRITGIPKGPLRDGRLFYGQQHDFYVSQVGENASAALRDSLVQARVRSSLMRDSASSPPDNTGWGGAGLFLSLGQLLALQLLLILLLFVLLGAWARSSADSATRLPILWQLTAAVLVVLATTALALSVGHIPLPLSSPAPSVGLPVQPPASAPFPSFAWLKQSVLRIAAGHLPFGISWSPSLWLLRGISALLLVAFPALALLLVALALAPFTRRRRAPLLTAWRGNLRRLLPPALAFGAALYLVLGLITIRLRADVVRNFADSRGTQMAQLVDRIGPQWHNPTIPPDAYRAQYPPQPPTE